jgi:glycosyltransferase involved in cell wall biosynthesis
MESVSVIIPCYNQGAYLGRAIQSVLGLGAEIIVVDDGSTDDTAAVSRQFEPQVRLIQQANAGVSAARNRGLAEATGSLLLFLDADDWLEPGALAEYRAAIEARPGAALYHGSCRWVDPVGLELARHPAVDISKDPFHRLLRDNFIFMGSVLFRRSILLELGGFDQALQGGEDWDLFLRTAARGLEFVPVPGAWLSYVRHPASASHAYSLMRRNWFEVIERHRHDHSGCWRCRLALIRARRNVRYNACVSALFPQLAREFAAGRWREGVSTLGRALWEDPMLLRVILLEVWLVHAFYLVRNRFLAP